jgi:glycosyltransferase involved in cell wall biosynthesis
MLPQIKAIHQARLLTGLNVRMPKLIRVTTVPLSLKYLVSGQARYMQEQGFEVIVISSYGPEREEIMRKEGCRHHIIPMTRKMTPLADVRSLWLLYRFFKKEKPDIVHSHTPKAGLLAMLAARLAGVKIRIHTIAGLRFVTTSGLFRRVLVAMEKLTAQSATHVWPNSFSLLDYINKIKLVKSKKLGLIGWGSSNGIDLGRYAMAALKEGKLNEAKRLVSYDDRNIYFLAVGRIVHDKGIDELLKAFTRVHAANDHTRLILLGAFEDDVDPVSDESKAVLKTHPAIIHVGWSEEVEYYMHLSFALIHASYREGFPNVLLQAGAMGCPVICSRIEGNIDLVEQEKTGLLFEVRNEKELQEKMELALANPAVIRQYAENLREKVANHFDQRLIWQQLHQRYQELLGVSPVNYN